MQGTVETPHTSGLFANPVFPCLNRNNEVEAPLDAGLANAEEGVADSRSARLDLAIYLIPCISQSEYHVFSLQPCCTITTTALLLIMLVLLRAVRHNLFLQATPLMPDITE